MMRDPKPRASKAPPKSSRLEISIAVKCEASNPSEVKNSVTPEMLCSLPEPLCLRCHPQYRRIPPRLPRLLVLRNRFSRACAGFEKGANRRHVPKGLRENLWQGHLVQPLESPYSNVYLVLQNSQIECAVQYIPDCQAARPVRILILRLVRVMN